MLEQCKKLLDSLKHYQISRLLQHIEIEILSKIANQQVISSRIVPYFPQEESKEYALPFTEFDREPNTISQIKKLINALYFARLTFEDLEGSNLDYSSAKSFYSKTIDTAYNACFFLTHLDVDLKDLFQDELAILIPIFSHIQSIAENHLPQTNTLLYALQPELLASKAQKVGTVVGIAVDQTRPLGATIDYHFLTQFSAVLPSYIGKLTQGIEEFISKIKAEGPLFSPKKLDELQRLSLHLLNDIENLNRNNLIASFKFLKYIYIIRAIIALSISSIEQMGKLSESSQDLVRHQLAQLKYSLFPSLFGLVDKIEDQTMLKPGTLSVPLMEQVKTLYNTLLYLPKKIINFEVKGEELLEIEDSRFIELRLDFTYKRISQAKQAEFKIPITADAYNQFFQKINSPLYDNYCLHQLPRPIKEELITHYKLLKPYMTKLDFDLNQLLIEKLTGAEIEPWSAFDFISKPWRWVKNQLPADHIHFIRAKQEALEHLITKDKNSQKFRIELNHDLLESVQQNTHWALFPYNEKINIYALDESTAFCSEMKLEAPLQFELQAGDNLLQNPEQLSALQTLELCQWYQNKQMKFTSATTAFSQLITRLKTQRLAAPQIGDNEGRLFSDHFEANIKAECRNLYAIAQPYVMSMLLLKAPALGEFSVQSILKLDKYLVALLSNRDPLPHRTIERIDPATVNMLLAENFLLDYFSDINLQWERKIRMHHHRAEQKFLLENELTELKPDSNQGSRAHHLIQHTHYSKCIREFRTSLFEVIKLFNNAMQNELTPHASGIPFPEMQDENKRVIQSQYVCALKDLFNTMYHLEGIVLQLEELHDKSYHSVYVNHVIHAFSHANEIFNASKRLASDPHFGFIAQTLIDKAQTLYAHLQEHTNAYQTNPDEVAYGTERVQYNSLWYVLNTFYINPVHIRALNNNCHLSEETLNELHLQAKKSTLFIESLIKKSDSYFKLFLQAPNMISFYQKLTTKFNEFTTACHNTTINHLGDIRSHILTPMVLEADRTEDALGLQPGSLSKRLRLITDEFFKGFVHSLSLTSQQHTALICDKKPLKERTKQIRNSIRNTTEYLNELDREYSAILALYQCMQKHKRLISGLSPASPLVIKLSKKELQNAYKQALLKLSELKHNPNLVIVPSEKCHNPAFDRLCNFGLSAEEHHTEIEALITASYHYYSGLKATYQMRLNTAHEKLSYLRQLLTVQSEEHEAFIEHYTTQSFEKYLTVLSDRHIGLQHNEYRNRLIDYLIQFKEEIIAQSKTADDIDHAIKRRLKEKTSIFERVNYREYYHLDTVIIALTQFRIYFNHSTVAIQNNNSLVESEQTLGEKINCTNALMAIAQNEKMTIRERLDQIKTQVEDPNFSRIILASKQTHFSFSFSYLKLCLLSLLEALDLYTPTKKKLRDNLNKALNNPPEISELSKHFGLFSANTKAKNVEPKPYALPQDPTLAAQSPRATY